jgi:hypothetical protein
MNTTTTPTIPEIKDILARAQDCLTCNASECHEFTPEGVDVCARLPWHKGRPVLKETLLEWNELVRRFEYANR